MSGMLPMQGGGGGGLESLTTCGICGKQLKEPTRLPCGHVFCKSCLVEQNKAGKLECSLCKTVHLVQNGDLDKVKMKQTLFICFIKQTQITFNFFILIIRIR